MAKALNARQQKFVEAYAACGNASEAARQAGYKGAPDRIGSRLLRNVGVSAAIAAQARRSSSRAIATQNDRHKFLTEVMRSARNKMADRVRACEILMRANGEFASVAVVTPPAGSGTPGVAVPADGGDDDGAPSVVFYMPKNGRDADH